MFIIQIIRDLQQKVVAVMPVFLVSGKFKFFVIEKS